MPVFVCQHRDVEERVETFEVGGGSIEGIVRTCQRRDDAGRPGCGRRTVVVRRGDLEGGSGIWRAPDASDRNDPTGRGDLVALAVLAERDLVLKEDRAKRAETADEDERRSREHEAEV
jgi:hypothetical protein